MESLISDICHIVAGKLQEKGKLLAGVRKEAKKMLDYLELIKVVIASAEKKEFMENEAVKLWRRDLNKVACDIEDVLEDWSNFQQQMQRGESSTSQRGNKRIPTPRFFKQFKDRYQIAHAIVEINSRLEDIADRIKKFDFEKNYVCRKDIVEPESTSTPFDDIIHDVPSQEVAKSRLIQKLVHDDFSDVSPNHIPIVSIVGMGGIGKTTLAQMLYNDQTVQNHFSSQMIFWVSVSDNSTELKVAKAIAVALGLEVADLPDHLTIVLTKIVDYIKGRTFLLVLDDVWENSVKNWDAILTCLGKGDAKQSRILLTTRSSDHAKMMQAVFTLAVGALSEDDSWLLFSHYALSRMAEEERMIVEGIAKELVRKCKGLPLALQVLGKFMRTKRATRQVWQDVLESKIWETKFKEDVFPSLVLSYLDLPSQVKRCFKFCSIFPKDTVMRKNRLIRLWMAQGFLQGNTTDTMEVYGEQYFEWLVARSFFRVREQPHIVIEPVNRLIRLWMAQGFLQGNTTDTMEVYGEQYFERWVARSFFRVREQPHIVIEPGDTAVTMHDLVHDFAQHISDGETVIVDPSIKVHTCKQARHLAVSGEIGESICSLYPNIDLKVLRTLLLSEHSTNISTNILEELCLNKSYIRALETPHISSSVDLRKLVHLRYLCLSSGDITFLSDGICDLPHLQTLDLEGCYRLKSLPKHFERLTCLRHLLFSDLANLPKGLGKLSSLQTLTDFPCSSVECKDCSSLEDLRDLNNLRGELWLRNLNKVEQAREATRAQLHMKKNIQQLRLEFGEGNPIIQSDVLDALEPARESNIERLRITGHIGPRCPGWIGKLCNLKEVVLDDVGMEVLPVGLGILRHLEILYIHNAHGVKSVGEEFLGTNQENITFFPKLTQLEFHGLSQWEHWEGSKEIRTVMPCLRHLTAMACRALQTLPGFLEHVHLESLMADSHHLLQQLELVEDDDHQRKLHMGNFHLPQTLKQLSIMSPKFAVGEMEPVLIGPTDAALEVGQQEYLNLSILEIDLRRRFPGSIIDLTCLKYVKLGHIEDECLPPLGIMCSLEELYIWAAEKVEKVGDEFLGIPNSNDNNNDGDHRGGAASPTFNAFPRLKKLTFESMPAWGEWEDPDYRNNNNLIIMPHLWCLEIVGCETLKSLPQFFEDVRLKKLSVKALRSALFDWKTAFMPKIRNTATEDELTRKMVKASSTILAQPDHFLEIQLRGVRSEWLCDWAKYCVRLTRLELYKCGEASLARLEVLHSLERLDLRYCDDVGRLGKGVLRIPSLKELRLEYMGCLEEWEDPTAIQLEDESRESQHDISSYSTIRSNLRILSVDSCPKLKALPSFLRSTPLECLSIIACPALETWWANEAGEDWRRWTSGLRQTNL